MTYTETGWCVPHTHAPFSPSYITSSSGLLLEIPPPEAVLTFIFHFTFLASYNPRTVCVKKTQFSGATTRGRKGGCGWAGAGGCNLIRSLPAPPCQLRWPALTPIERARLDLEFSRGHCAGPTHPASLLPLAHSVARRSHCASRLRAAAGSPSTPTVLAPPALHSISAKTPGDDQPILKL